jgi:hypothetical protein
MDCDDFTCALHCATKDTHSSDRAAGAGIFPCCLAAAVPAHLAGDVVLQQADDAGKGPTSGCWRPRGAHDLADDVFGFVAPGAQAARRAGRADDAMKQEAQPVPRFWQAVRLVGLHRGAAAQLRQVGFVPIELYIMFESIGTQRLFSRRSELITRWQHCNHPRHATNTFPWRRHPLSERQRWAANEPRFCSWCRVPRAHF